MPFTIDRPAADEYAPFYAGYIAQVPEGRNPLDVLAAQLETVPALLAAVPEGGAHARYAPGTWSIKEVVGHLADAERVFAYRLLRVARGDQTPLAAFDENVYVRAAGFDARSLADLAAEWAAVRRATLTLVKSFATEAWLRRGVASGAPISARALVFIVAGHTAHHVAVLQSRYGVGRV